MNNNNYANEDSNKFLPMDSSVDESRSSLQFKIAPISTKLLDDNTKSPHHRFLPSNMMRSDSVENGDGGGYKMISQSYGGDPSPFLSSMMRATPPPPCAVQR
jgi:hypothetical protein